MERLKIIFSILFIFSLSISVVYAQNDNLILNASVEQGIGSPNYWFAGSNAYWSNEGHTGIHSLGLNPTASEGDWRSQCFNVSGNQKYRFTFWVKGSYTAGEFYVYVRWFRNPDGTNFITQYPYRIWGSYDTWQCVNDTFTAPPEAKSCDIFFRAEPGSTGNIQTDDFYLAPIIEPTPSYVGWFKELFYGSGKWLSLIVMMAIIIIVATLFPYGAILFLPLTIFLGVDYFHNIPASSDFMWEQ